MTMSLLHATSKPRILLADDHGLILEGLRRILQDDFDVVGSVEDGRTLLEAVERLAPDLVLVDISMPLLNGLDAARKIKHDHPNVKIVVVTMQTDRDYVREAFRAGASGYVLKRAAACELFVALHQVLQGKTYTSPLANDIGPELGPEEDNGRDLTQRQREVLQLVAEGRTAKEMAHILGISVKTIDFHKASITHQLGLHSTAELTRYALDIGLVPRMRPPN